MYERKTIGLREAQRGVEAMLKEASKESERPMTVGVADERGIPILIARMDGCQDFQFQMVVRKLYSAAQWRMDTRTAQESIPREGLAASGSSFNTGEVTTLPSGLVIVEPSEVGMKGEKTGLRFTTGTVYGSVAACGRSTEAHGEDEEIAEVGRRAIQEVLWEEG